MKEMGILREVEANSTQTAYSTGLISIARISLWLRVQKLANTCCELDFDQ